ncbi:hypothetical protein PO883_14825 [Massilia sp. DJPM01]|uniref:hypothetical protein n=1 Tax=Massilia sp. DJPM01 TaxID=3024404 RepID=UPI00259D55A5|nr:hypothetical protein [Massilia sp. DJPM01]MDM5178471.1 hypothetical protein [Massilia sp. DJPM01]
MQHLAGICWPHEATVGHITVATGQLSGHFPADHGDDALVACVLVAAGKYRNGAARHWCRTHQTYWGVKADLAALAHSGQRRCARHAEPMGYALHPPLIDLAACASVTIASAAGGGMEVASVPAGLQASRAGRYPAVAICNSGPRAPFPGSGIVQVNITPPALLAYTRAASAGPAPGCVNCARCGHPHLDLGSFAQTPHRRHYCGNCGCDSTHSPAPMLSSPLHALSILFAGRLRFA